jgi:hypothetical protein
MLKTKKAGTLLIPAGAYYFSKGVLIAKDEDNNKTFDFVSIKITGSGKAYGGMGGNGAETTLIFTNPNDFGIGIQMGKGVTLENLTLYGTNDAAKPEGKAISTARLGDYVKKGVRSNRFSPHAGIVIDPFGSKAAADQYPGWANAFPQQGGSGSTDVHISDCSFRNWVVGIGNSMNGTKANAECILIENIWMESVSVAISSCQAQAKTIICRNIKVWGGCWKVFDTQKFGEGNGNGFNVDGANLAGSIKWICDAPAYGTGRTSLNYVFAESTYGIGGPDEDADVIPQGRIDINQSQLDFMGQSQHWNRANAVAKCGNLSIRDSYVGFYSGSDPCPMMVITNQLTLDNVRGNQIYNYDFLSAPNEPHIYSIDNWYNPSEQAKGRNIKLTHGDVFYYKAGDYTIRRQYVGNTFYVFQTNAEVTKSGDNNATLTGVKNLLKGDVLYTNGAVDFRINMPVAYPVGIVSKVSADGVTVDYCSLKPGKVSLFTIDQPILLDLSQWRGDVESGNKKVKTKAIFGERNRPFNDYKGKRIYNKNFPEGTYIVDWDDSGLMLSQPPNKSSKNYSFTLSDNFVIDTLGKQ